MSHEYPVNELCATLDVSPSGYHAWATARPARGRRPMPACCR